MKRLDIVCNWFGLALELYDNGEFLGDVRADSVGFFEDIWKSGFEKYGLPRVRYPEERLLGQTVLESKLKNLTDTSKTLWSHNEAISSVTGRKSALSLCLNSFRRLFI